MIKDTQYKQDMRLLIKIIRNLREYNTFDITDLYHLTDSINSIPDDKQPDEYDSDDEDIDSYPADPDKDEYDEQI